MLKKQGESMLAHIFFTIDLLIFYHLTCFGGFLLTKMWYENEYGTILVNDNP
jgi:hypothetical protein